MNSKNDLRWRELLSFKNREEEIELEADMISIKIASEIEKLIEKKGLTKKEFAKIIGTSAAYVTQILRGDKRINMKFLAQIIKSFDVSFEFQFVNNDEINIDFMDTVFDIAGKADKKEKQKKSTPPKTTKKRKTKD